MGSEMCIRDSAVSLQGLLAESTPVPLCIRYHPLDAALDAISQIFFFWQSECLGVEVDQSNKYFLYLFFDFQFELDGFIVVGRSSEDHSGVRDRVFGGPVAETVAVVLQVALTDAQLSVFDVFLLHPLALPVRLQILLLEQLFLLPALRQQ